MLRAVATTPKITYTQTHIYTRSRVALSPSPLPPIMSLSPSFPRDTLPCEQVFIFVRLCCWSSLSLSFEKRLFFYINKGITILCVFASRAHAMIYYVCSTCRLNDFLYFCFFFFYYYYIILLILLFLLFLILLIDLIFCCQFLSANDFSLLFALTIITPLIYSCIVVVELCKLLFLMHRMFD